MWGFVEDKTTSFYLPFCVDCLKGIGYTFLSHSFLPNYPNVYFGFGLNLLLFNIPFGFQQRKNSYLLSIVMVGSIFIPWITFFFHNLNHEPSNRI